MAKKTKAPKIKMLNLLRCLFMAMPGWLDNLKLGLLSIAKLFQIQGIVEVENPELNPGDTCPAEECDGRLYEMSEPGTLVRVTGALLLIFRAK